MKKRDVRKISNSSYFIPRSICLSINHTLKNGVEFFLEIFILIPENDEIPCGPGDQRKGRHFSVTCYI